MSKLKEVFDEQLTPEQQEALRGLAGIARDPNVDFDLRLIAANAVAEIGAPIMLESIMREVETHEEYRYIKGARVKVTCDARGNIVPKGK